MNSMTCSFGSELSALCLTEEMKVEGNLLDGVGLYQVVIVT